MKTVPFGVDSKCIRMFNGISMKSFEKDITHACFFCCKCTSQFCGFSTHETTFNNSRLYLNLNFILFLLMRWSPFLVHEKWFQWAWDMLRVKYSRTLIIKRFFLVMWKIPSCGSSPHLNFPSLIANAVSSVSPSNKIGIKNVGQSFGVVDINNEPYGTALKCCWFVFEKLFRLHVNQKFRSGLKN